MRTDRYRVGKQGEEEACTYLRSLGHSIVARNWRSGHCEIDIISAIDSEIHIVEVKSRTAPLVADPTANVNRSKQRKLAYAANAFLHSEFFRSLPERGEVEVFFDVVSVVFEENGFTIDYYPKAYTPIYV
ncbi:MAG: YraN family protein [Bacteroidales bacterium]|nr:YraN family protein [Bacteroidales bacterium]